VSVDVAPVNVDQIRQAAVERMLARRRPPVWKTARGIGPEGSDVRYQVHDEIGEYQPAASLGDALDDLILQTPLFGRPAALLLQIADAGRTGGPAAAVLVARQAEELPGASQDWLREMADKWLAAAHPSAFPVLGAIVQELRELG
jgi:hypothetical protein